MRPTSLVLALVAASGLTLVSGCSALDRVNDALYATGVVNVTPSRAREVASNCGVTVLTGSCQGRGVIVGPHTVLTVEHVVGKTSEIEVATSSLCWTKAHVSRRIASYPEDVIELELEVAPGLLAFGGFEPDRVARLGGGRPEYVISQHGVSVFGRGQKHGDSGSPVLDARGQVVGCLVGRTDSGESVYSPIPTQAKPRSVEPETAEPIVLARLSR